METPKNPNPHASPSSGRRRTMRPVPGSAGGALSPSFSRCALDPATAAAPGDDDALYEHPDVSLFEWWLERVEEDDRKVAVGGQFRRNKTIVEFSSAPIAKRHGPCVLETEDGIKVGLDGLPKVSRMRENGYPFVACKQFLVGFPYWWADCNVRYPRTTSSHTGSQPRSSDTSNSQEKLAVSQPRLEGYSFNDDIPTTEMPASSNDESERYAVVCNEVYSMEIDLIAVRTLREGGHGDIDTNVSLASTMEFTNDEGHQKTPVASSKTEGCRKRARSTPLNEKVASGEDMSTSVHSNVQSLEKPVGKSKKQRTVREKLEGTTRSPRVSSPSEHVYQSPLTHGRASLSMLTPESLKLRKSSSGRVVIPALDSGCQRIVYNMDGSFRGIGSVSGVIDTNLPAPCEVRELKSYTRRKKKAESTLKTYSRRKKAH
ncbi:hypothetical protein ACP70R_009464 [Stipagrostis hirtigluma subsp. patula]